MATTWTRFKGGTLLPAPDIVKLLHTDAAGGLALSPTWPAGVLRLSLQDFISDPVGPNGYAASHALRLEGP